MYIEQDKSILEFWPYLRSRVERVVCILGLAMEAILRVCHISIKQAGGNNDKSLNIFKPLYNINLSDIPDVEELITWMHHDKKVDKNEIRLILLHINRPYVHTVMKESSFLVGRI